MVTLNDPRVPIYAQPTKNDPTKYIGLQNGMDNVTVTPFFNTTSRPGAIFYPGATVYGTFGTAAGKQTPSYIMTAAEVAFIQAEAANRGIGGLTAGQAAAFYNNGVTLSITQWGGTAAQAAAYLAQPGVAYAGGATGLQQIGLQKWISLFTQSTEAWSEWRRTGNPASIKMGPGWLSWPIREHAPPPEVWWGLAGWMVLITVGVIGVALTVAHQTTNQLKLLQSMAMSVGKDGVLPVLKEEGGISSQRERRFTFRGLLVVAQLALAIVVLISAGLCIRSLRNLLSAHQGCCRRGLGIHSDGFVLDLNRLFGLGNRKRKVGADIAARTEDEFLLFPGEASQFNG